MTQPESAADGLGGDAWSFYSLWHGCQPTDGIQELLLLLLYRMCRLEGDDVSTARFKAATAYGMALEYRGAERYGKATPVSLIHYFGDLDEK